MTILRQRRNQDSMWQRTTVTYIATPQFIVATSCGFVRSVGSFVSLEKRRGTLHQSSSSQFQVPSCLKSKTSCVVLRHNRRFETDAQKRRPAQANRWAEN